MDANHVSLQEVVITHGDFDQPVWVDIITGGVYEIPAGQWSGNGGTYTLQASPWTTRGFSSPTGA